MKNVTILLLLLVLAVLTGCARSPKYSFEVRKISIDSTPSGVKVYQINSAYRNETFLGTTPIKDQPVSVLTAVRGKVSSIVMDWMVSQVTMLNIRAEKTGYQDYKGNLSTDPLKITAHSIQLDPK